MPRMTDRSLQILLALTDGPLHGYGIKLEVEERTDGRVSMGSGTLYEAIQRLQEWGWIEEVDRPAEPGPSGGPPRRFYAMTHEGRSALAREVDRMREIVSFARGRGVLEG